jgi:hypothetical protein
MIEVLPQPRIDVLVDDAAGGGPRRLTTYTGTAWFGGRMDPYASMSSHQHGRLQSPFFLPDSLPYDTALAGQVQITTSFGVQSAGDGPFVVVGGAALVADPSGQLPMWLQAQPVGRGRVPLAIAYRIDVLGPPDAVLAPPV